MFDSHLFFFFSLTPHIILGFTGITLSKEKDFLERWRRTQRGVISSPLLPSCQASSIQRNRNNKYRLPVSMPFDIFRYRYPFWYRYLLLMVSAIWYRYWPALSLFHLLDSQKVCVTLACQTITVIIWPSRGDTTTRRQGCVNQVISLALLSKGGFTERMAEWAMRLLGT